MSKANQYRNNVSLKNNDDAVSPVIGTILMVAVTVILAAVIAAFIFGFTGNMPKAPNVSYFQIERTGATNVSISTTSPAIVEVIVTSVSYGAPGKEPTVLSGADVADLNTKGLLELNNETTVTTPCEITIKGTVSGLAEQTLQQITV